MSSSSSSDDSRDKESDSSDDPKAKIVWLFDWFNVRSASQGSSQTA